MAFRKLRLYTDFNYRAGNSERELMPIVWAQIDTSREADKLKKHHARATHFELVPQIEDSDWCVLPDVWPTYMSERKGHLAKSFAQIAASHKKYVLIWSGGDPEWIVPIKNAILIQEGLYKNIERLPNFAFERPGFVLDYVQTYCDGEWHPVPKAEKPAIGFCGQAESKLISRLYFYTQNTITTLRYRLGISSILPNLHGYHVDLRAETLSRLQAFPNVETNFLVRNQYKSGLASGKPLTNEKARLEFVNNIFDNMYTVCMRGGGNFSKRFYETLACGRIPILIDTDTMLPYEEFIQWDNYIVRVKHEDLPNIGEIVCDFHSRISSEDFCELQSKCRQLWLQYLTPSGYYSHFGLYLALTHPDDPSTKFFREG